MFKESLNSDTFIVPGAAPEPIAADVFETIAINLPEVAPAAPKDSDIYHEMMQISKEIELCRASL